MTEATTAFVRFRVLRLGCSVSASRRRRRDEKGGATGRPPWLRQPQGALQGPPGGASHGMLGKLQVSASTE